MAVRWGIVRCDRPSPTFECSAIFIYYKNSLLDEKKEVSFQGTRKTAANSDILPYPGNFLPIVRKAKYRYLLLYEHIHSILRKDFFFIF